MNKDKNIHILYKLPGTPDSYWSIDTFVKVPSEPLYKKLDILKVSDVFNMNILNFVYDSLNKINPEQFHTYYNYLPNTRNTAAVRNKNLTIPVSRTVTYGLKSIKYVGSKLWNELRATIRNSESRKVFSTRVKQSIINT